MKNSVIGGIFRTNPLKIFPMINRPWHLLHVYVAGFFLLAGCSTVHKINHKDFVNEKTTDHSIVTGITNNETIITEKADTIVATKPDSANVDFYISDEDTLPAVKEVDGKSIHLIIRAKTVFKNGKPAGTSLTAIAIKKAEEVPINISKQTISHTTEEQTKHNDIIQQKKENKVDKEVTRKPGLKNLFWILLLLILIIIAYYLLKRQYL